MRPHQQQQLGGSHGSQGQSLANGLAGSGANSRLNASNKVGGLGLDLAGLSGSLSSSYQVPSVDGRLIQATPLSFCLRYRPPTIAVVYKLEKRPASTLNSKNPPPKQDFGKKIKKYIHEIVVESMLTRTADLNELTLKLCERESAYLNPSVISKSQVLDLLTKLYKHKHGVNPPLSATSNKESTSKESAPTASASAAAAKSSEAAPEPTGSKSQGVSASQQRVDTKSSNKNEHDDEDYDDDWDMLVDDGPQNKKDTKKDQDDKKGNLFEQKAAAAQSKTSLDDFDDLDNIPTIKDAVKKQPGLQLDSDEDDYDKPPKGGVDPDTNKFDKQQKLNDLGGGSAAAAVVDPEENTASANNNIFDTSKDKIKPGPSGSGASAGTKQPSQSQSTAGAGAAEDEEAQIAAEIEEQFQVLYDGDPDLREVLKKSDVRTFTVQEKYQIIDAYMAGGGAQGLQIELDEGDNDGEEGLGDMDDADLEFDEDTIEQMPEESKRRLEAQFLQLYTHDEAFRAALGEHNTPDQLQLFQKYHIMMEYGKSAAGPGADEVNASGISESGKGEVVVINGKQYTRVQIEGHTEEFLMDENTNIYDMQLNLVGIQGDSDEEEGQ